MTPILCKYSILSTLDGYQNSRGVSALCEPGWVKPLLGSQEQYQKRAKSQVWHSMNRGNSCYNVLFLKQIFPCKDSGAGKNQLKR